MSKASSDKRRINPPPGPWLYMHSYITHLICFFLIYCLGTDHPFESSEAGKHKPELAKPHFVYFNLSQKVLAPSKPVGL